MTAYLTLCAFQAIPIAHANETEAVQSLPKRKVVAHCFESGSDGSAIAPDTAPVLAEAVSVIGPEATIAVVADPPLASSHGDSYRRFLARWRAKAVRRHLIDHGLAPSRVTVRNGATDEAGALVPAAPLAHSQPVELHVE